jgi:alpha-tubulin suppressor-like RCC1 family protein
MENRCHFHGLLLAAALTALTQLIALSAEPVQGAEVVAWGNIDSSQTTMLAGLSNVVAVATGDPHILALRADGTVAAWGLNDYGQTDVPAGLSNVVAVATGMEHSLAVQADGMVVAWGANYNGQASVPAGLSNVVAVAGGASHNLALRVDGTVIAWGDNRWGQSNVPAGLTNVLGVAAGVDHSLALRANGTVATWGHSLAGTPGMPVGLSNVVGVAAGTYHSVALRVDGTMAAWGGLNYSGENNVPVGLSNVVAVEAGGANNIVLRADGTVVVWGWNGYGQTNVPAELDNVVAVGAGWGYCLALRGLPAGMAAPQSVGSRWLLGAVGQPFYHRIMAKNVPTGYCATGLPAGLVLDGASGIITGRPTQGGSYAVVLNATNALGADLWAVTLVVNGGPSGTPPSVAGGTVEGLLGDPFYYLVRASNADWVGVSGLPAGWTFNPTNRMISGRLLEVGTISLNLTATNRYGTSSAALTVHVSGRPPNVVSGVVNGVLGSWLSYQVIVTNGDWVEVSGLPAGLDFNPASRVISGTPLEWGNYWASITASNLYGTSSGLLTLVVSPGTRRVPEVVAWGSNGTGQTNVPAGLSNVVMMAAGKGHSLALRSDGTVVSWGYNFSSQPDVPAGLSNVVAVVPGANFSLALKADGTVAVWGTYNNGKIEIPMTVPAGLSNVVAVSAGEAHGLALRADGTVATWGPGDTSTTDGPAGLSNVVAVAAGWVHNLALRADGTVAAWGSDNYGQTDVPAGLSNVVAVAGGASHSLAVRADGTVVAWGWNALGQTDVPAGLSDVVAVAGGYVHSLALRADGTVIGWGYNGVGQTTVPAGLANVVAIAAGGWTGQALTGWPKGMAAPQRVGPRWLMGAVDQPFYYRIMAKNGPISFKATGLPLGLVLDGASGIITGRPTQGGSYAVVLSATNALGADSWAVTLVVNGAPSGPPPSVVGGTVEGLLGNPFYYFVSAANADWLGVAGLPAGWTFNPSNRIISGSLLEVGTFSLSLTATNRYGTSGATLTIHVSGRPPTVMSGVVEGVLGSWLSYQVVVTNGDWVGVSGLPAGVGFNPTNRVISGTPSELGSFLVSITASNFYGTVSGSLTIHVLPATQEFGEVVAWGSNHSGQAMVPAGLSNVVAVGAGEYHSLAVRADGTVAAWGDNTFGQTDVPAGLSNVVAVAAGYSYSLALRADGRVIAWGNNSDAQTAVLSGLSNVVAVSAWGRYNLALRADGTLVEWWNDTTGQRTVPAGLSNVVAVASGWAFSLALRANGTVAAWGNGGNGQTTVPAGLSNVVAVAAGQSHSLALRADGTVVGWGLETAPVGLSNVVAVAGGYGHSLAVRADGTVVAWGADYLGQATVPAGLSNAVGVAAGEYFSLALRGLPAGMAAPQMVGSRWLLGAVGQPFYHRIMAKNGPTGYSATGLPEGLVLDGASGLITGKPALGGTCSVVLSATNELGADSWGITLVVNGTPKGTAPTLVGGSVYALLGSLLYYQVITSNADWLEVSGLPADLAFNPTNRVISGTPSAVGIFPISLKAGNRYGTSGAVLNIYVSGPRPIVVGGVVEAVVGSPLYYQVLATNADWVKVSGLPASLTFNPNNRVISGSPLVVGTFSISLTVTNRYGTSSASLTIHVSGRPPDVVGEVVEGVMGSWLSYQVIATNADWLEVWGLPAGLVFDPAGWVISGTPRELGEFSVSLTATNGYGASSGSLTIHVAEPVNVSEVFASGDNAFGQTSVPAGLSNVVALAGGFAHNLVLRVDGTVAAWGNNDYGQATVPVGLSNVVAVAGGANHSLTLRADGNVAAWGANDLGQAMVPAELSNVVAVAGGDFHSLALRADGIVVAWGGKEFGRTMAPFGLSNVVAVAAGFGHNLALRAEGTVAAWGWNLYGQTTVPLRLTNVVAVAAGWGHSLALRADGTVAAWGNNEFGQATVPGGLGDVVALAARGNQSVALRADGSVVAWGQYLNGTNVVSPAGLSNMVAVAAGGDHTLALSFSPRGIFKSRVVEPGACLTLAAPTAEGQPLAQWYRDDRAVFAGNLLVLTNVQAADLGLYVAAREFTFGRLTSAAVQIRFPGPDLQVSAMRTPVAAYAGWGQTLYWTVVNRGSRATAGEWEERVYLSEDTVVEHGRLVAVFAARYPLEPNQSRFRVQSLTVPKGLEPERDYWWMIVTDADNDLEEEDELNNTRVSAQPMRLRRPLPLGEAALMAGGSNSAMVTGGTGVKSEQPRVEVVPGAEGTPALVLYAQPGWECVIEERGRLAGGEGWREIKRLTVSGVVTRVPLARTNGQGFYRAVRVGP